MVTSIAGISLQAIPETSFDESDDSKDEETYKDPLSTQLISFFESEYRHRLLLNQLPVKRQLRSQRQTSRGRRKVSIVSVVNSLILDLYPPL